MTGLRRRWADSFAVRVVGLLLLAGLFPVLLQFGVSYQTTRQAVLDVATEHQLQILAAQVEYLALQTEQVEALAANLAQVDEIATALAAVNQTTDHQAYDLLATQARMGYILSNYRNLKGLVSIDIFALNGVHFHVGESLVRSMERTDLRDEFLARSQAAGPQLVWQGVEDNILPVSSESKVLVASQMLHRVPPSGVGREPVGLLVISLSTQYLHHRFSRLDLGAGGYLVALDARQRMIYAPQAELIGQPVPPGFVELLQGMSGARMTHIDGADRLLAYRRMPAKDWTVLTLVPKDTLLKPMSPILQTGLILLALAGFGVVLVIRHLYARVVKPVGDIALRFGEFQSGRLAPTWRMAEQKSLSQVRALTHWFNAFLEGEARRVENDTRLRIAATAFESQQGMFITDAQQRILQVNRAFTTLTGYTPEEAVGQTPRLLSSGQHDGAYFAQMHEVLSRTGSWSGEIWNRRKNGSPYPEWLTITAVKNDHGAVTHYVASMMDITQRKADEMEIRNLAFYDALTQLPNRRLLYERLQHLLADVSRRKVHFALMLMDLDKFKVINDTLGHAVGDLLLRKVAERLLASVREGDTVARLGGDEFVVLLQGLSEDPVEAGRQAESVAQKMLQALNAVHDLNGVPFQGSGSIGVTLFGRVPADAEELLQQADIAMYQAKESGRNAIRFFDPTMQTALVERAALESEMRQAVMAHHFTLRFQPIVSDQGVRGAEVLVRWVHADRGLMSPADFIPLAEETGVIVPLGLWVLESACRTLETWADDPRTADLTLSVNVSPRQFRQGDFVGQVVRILKLHRVNPQRLKLEITESLLLDDVDSVVDKMDQLIRHGVRFALDDFGTGYSSLAYLKKLPLTEIKIDQSFVRDVLIDDNDAITVRTILALGQSMGLEVVAEGVETDGHRAFLEQHGCRLFQGYWFSAPVVESEFLRWLSCRSG